MSDRPAERSGAERSAELQRMFEALAATPRAHDFFAVLRRVDALRPEQPRSGRAVRPSQEAIRLGQEAELDFAPAAVEVFEARVGTARAPRLGVRFFGLLGPHGPMPLHFTEYVRERLRSRADPTLARFLDVFHHRLLAMFYRAWAQAQPAVQHDRPGDDRYAAWLGASFGAESQPAPSRVLPRDALLNQAGLLGSRSAHPEGLSKLLAQFFRVPVAIEEHVAHWLVLDRDDQTQLAYARNRSERSAAAARALGVSATAGTKCRDRQYKFRVVLGPLGLAAYERMLPRGRDWSALVEWVRAWVGLGLRFDVQLVLARNEVPAPRLGKPLRLGVTTWIGRRANAHDRGDLRVRPDTSSLLLRNGTIHA